jgi:hypothetical protein
VTRRSTGTDYRAGLRRFRGDLDFPIANQATAAAIIERTAAGLGAVTEVWWDDEDSSGPRLRVVFAGDDDPRLFVRFGYVHHQVQLTGSVPAYGTAEGSGWWETHMPENRIRDAVGTTQADAPRPVCPNCFLEVPLTGVCDCRWVAEADPHRSNHSQSVVVETDHWGVDPDSGIAP